MRDAIHPELMIALGRADDITTLQDRGAYQDAAAYGREMRGVTRLLDDFGWDPEGDAAEHGIMLDASELTRLVGRLQARATAALAEEIPEARATEHPYRDSLRAIAACGTIVRLLGESAMPAVLGRGEGV